MSHKAVPVPVGPASSHHDVRNAWVSVALLPLAVLVGALAGGAALSVLGYPSGSEEAAPPGVALAVGIPVVLLAATPGALALRFGMRARREGDVRGLVPAVVGAVLAGGFVLVNMLAVSFGR